MTEWHRRFGENDWVCRESYSTFETAEALENDGTCPWCGRVVIDATEEELVDAE